ncbi:unnamed protein product [Alopecurus aequalis]
MLTIHGRSTKLYIKSKRVGEDQHQSSIHKSNLICLKVIRAHTSHPLPARQSSMEDYALMISPELRDAVAKVAVFLLVQGLVYLILTKSSDVFSKDKVLRSLSFRTMRSMSVRRVLAPLSDVPVGTDEPGSAPSPSYYSSWSSRRWSNHED